MRIKIKGVSINKKPRADGRWQGYYKDDKVKQYVYGSTREEVEEKIRKLIRTGIKKKKHTINGAPTDFEDFAMFYFNTFRARKVAKDTLKGDLSRFNNYLKPVFKNRPIRSITPSECQELIDRIQESGKGKTADEVYSLLSVIIKMAMRFGIVQRNPLEIVYHEKHERINGKVLKIDDIKRLIASKNKYLPYYMIALYTGLRPNEYEKFTINGNFIVAVNSKRKNGKTEYKKIPIMRELKPFLTGNFAKIPPYEQLRIEYKTILPDFSLKDLRKTFNSRCIECGVNEIVRKLWMGHSLGELGKAYTELSDEYFLKEAKKFYFFTQN